MTSLNSLNLETSWATIGSFDGVHRGHQAILTRLVAQAHAAKANAVVITFFPHPAVLLRGIQGPFYITSPEERARLLEALGVDYVITLPFTSELAALSANDFMQELCAHLGLRSLWVGEDFALGRSRQADVTALSELGESMGYTVHVTPTELVDGEKVSSSLIRQEICLGNVERANNLLGHNFTINGQVTHGNGRGKNLGFPTANISLWPLQIIPAAGVYACWAWLGGERFAAATNVGMRPTFEKEPVSYRVEPHLLDINRDLYGQEIKLEFVQRLRPEQRFPSVSMLMAQIQQDVKQTREVLSNVT